MKTLTLGIFLTAYISLIILPKHRAAVVACAAILLTTLGSLSGRFTSLQAVSSINWNVMGIFMGTLILAELFTYSRAPAVLAEHLVNRAGNVGVAILFICTLSSAISAVMENVATVLIVAPVAFAICKKVNVSPVVPIIALAISSNLQGTATLIGDPPSMLLAGYAKLTFNDFFIYLGRPGIFFAVEIGAVFSFGALWLIFRKHRQKVKVERMEKIKVWMPVFLLVAFIVLLVLSSFADPEFGYFAGVISVVLGFLGFMWFVVDRKQPVRTFLKGLDWETAIFLASIFVLVGGLGELGWIDDIASGLGSIIGKNHFLAFVAIVTGSVLISAVVDNIPYLAAMIPVAQRLADGLSASPGATPYEQALILFGLLIGSCLGGNITPVGAAANIVGVGLLKKHGYEVSFFGFVKVGLLFTIAAVVPAILFLWLIWGH